MHACHRVPTVLLLRNSLGTHAAETNGSSTPRISSLAPHSRCSMSELVEIQIYVLVHNCRIPMLLAQQVTHEVAKDQGSHAWGQPPDMLSSQHSQLDLSFLGMTFSVSSWNRTWPCFSFWHMEYLFVLEVLGSASFLITQQQGMSPFGACPFST